MFIKLLAIYPSDIIHLKKVLQYAGITCFNLKMFEFVYCFWSNTKRMDFEIIIIYLTILFVIINMFTKKKTAKSEHESTQFSLYNPKMNFLLFIVPSPKGELIIVRGVDDN